MSWFINKISSIISSPSEEKKTNNNIENSQTNNNQQDNEVDNNVVITNDEEDNNTNSDKIQITEILSSILKSAKLGSDLLRMGISLPASIYEPLSILQRQSEMLEYSMLLDRAYDTKDSIDRLVLIAGFAVSGYSGTKRFHNNFNPILGETFEYTDKRNGTRFLGEQVSHHPPISATHGHNTNWMFYQNSCAVTKFLGNAIDINTQGRTHITFNDTGDNFYYTNPLTRVHNLILGKMCVEHYGELFITNLRTQDTCKLFFKKCNFFQSVDSKIEGWVKNANGDTIVNLEGKWDEYLNATWLVDTSESKAEKTDTVWRLPENNFLNDKYHLTKFAATLNDIDDERLLPPTDSRFRLDRRWLQQGENTKATKSKKMMEERQRRDKKLREEENREWEPVWFKLENDDDRGEMWIYQGNYWEQKEIKAQSLENGGNTDELFNGGNARNTAADFKSYPDVDE